FRGDDPAAAQIRNADQLGSEHGSLSGLARRSQQPQAESQQSPGRSLFRDERYLSTHSSQISGYRQEQRTATRDDYSLPLDRELGFDESLQTAGAANVR